LTQAIKLIAQKMLDSYDIANSDRHKETIKNGKKNRLYQSQLDFSLYPRVSRCISGYYHEWYYIFVSPDLGGKIAKYKVIRNSVTNIASDHWPVVVEIKQ